MGPVTLSAEELGGTKGPVVSIAGRPPCAVPGTAGIPLAVPLPSPFGTRVLHSSASSAETAPEEAAPEGIIPGETTSGAASEEASEAASGASSEEADLMRLQLGLRASVILFTPTGASLPCPSSPRASAFGGPLPLCNPSSRLPCPWHTLGAPSLGPALSTVLSQRSCQRDWRLGFKGGLRTLTQSRDRRNLTSSCSSSERQRDCRALYAQHRAAGCLLLLVLLPLVVVVLALLARAAPEPGWQDEQNVLTWQPGQAAKPSPTCLSLTPCPAGSGSSSQPFPEYLSAHTEQAKEHVRARHCP